MVSVVKKKSHTYPKKFIILGIAIITIIILFVPLVPEKFECVSISDDPRIVGSGCNFEPAFILFDHIIILIEGAYYQYEIDNRDPNAVFCPDHFLEDPSLIPVGVICI